VPQPLQNHNGGTLLFDSHEMLLITLGDGGGGGDPFDNGQDGMSMLGSILR
jgi:glucose/arabinose dehydrogenase